MLICISGPSGVGKTTLSKIVAASLGIEKVTYLCGDDLHKWSRTSDQWKTFTHLEPLANNLELGREHILKLLNSQPVFRARYNHSTGLFDAPVKIFPTEKIVYEGLHALYDEQINEKSYLSLYVETESSLKQKWKINRDINERGYSLDKVIDSIQRRKTDEEKYIVPQRNNADAILEFYEATDGKISLRMTQLQTPQKKSAVEKILDLYEKIEALCYTAENVSKEAALNTFKGGNISIKYDNGILISESGVDFSNISTTSGYCFSGGKKHIGSTSASRPSMELDLHLKMGKYTLHTHPTFATALLSSMESESIISKIFGDEVQFVSYSTPGKSLANSFTVQSKNVFLQNHGLFISSETSLQDCLEKTITFENTCRDFFLECINGKELFPDAVIFPRDNELLNYFMVYLIEKKKLTPRPLTAAEKEELINLEEEKYRKSK